MPRQLLLLAFSFIVLATISVAARAEENDQGANLTRPDWKVGETWTIETLTERIQGREEKTSRDAKPIRWQFRVAKLEDLAGRDCYRIEIECLAKGRIRPKSVVWVDEESGFLRQFETQMAVGGTMRTIRESYDHAKDRPSPVITPINTLPIAMPSFESKGAKANEFSYISAPMPAGAKSKDLGLISFAHNVNQTQGKASSKALKEVPASYSKGLEKAPVTQVTIGAHGGEVTQLWQQGKPWPVYVNNGRTKAYLVSNSQ